MDIAGWKQQPQQPYLLPKVCLRRQGPKKFWLSV
jgi:hypothetical protein